jgi:hypothetical protein
VESCIYDHGVGTCDESYTENIEDHTNGSSCSKPESILQNEDQTIPGRCAEVLASDGDLDVCILCDELDESLKAVKAVSGSADDGFDNLVFFVLLF